MLVAIGKGIELDVDVTRFNSEVNDHIVRTGLRNLLMDALENVEVEPPPVKKTGPAAKGKKAA